MEQTQATFWLGFRQSLLLAVDCIERLLNISPTTAEIRQWYKASKRGGDSTAGP